MHLHETPIAIVGMASVFPNAENVQRYWENILHEVDCLTEVPPSRWRWEDYYDSDPSVPDKTYCKRGGFLPDIDFNPMEFGMRPNILELTDASQLLSLVVAREALKDAGYDQMSDDRRQETGVILGVGGGQKLMIPLIARLQYPIWERVLRSSGVPENDIPVITEKIKQAYIPWEENSFPGLLGNVIAGRIANRFDLGGANCVVDAACAASLAATRMAISELVMGNADMMITGGVDTDNSIFMYMSFSKTPAFSKAQQARPFDAKADGMVVGEGVGMVVLKRLADAERDGDRVYAVIRGLGAASDGRYKSIYAPRAEGQALALERAYEDAGFDKRTVGLIEAHGTGTVAGDATEFTTLNRVFREDNPTKQHIALGSVKSQIGHTKAAAGAASLIKVATALHHKVLPPTIKVDQPHPKYNIEDSPFYLNTHAKPWFRADADTPRRAGVSAFGFGGTNYHIVLEEYQPEHRETYRFQRTPHSLILSANTSAQLLAECQQARQSLTGDNAAQALVTLAQACQRVTIPPSAARVGFVARTAEEAVAHLDTAIKQLQTQAQAEAWTHPKGVYFRRQALPTQGKVVALFSGQGAQYVNMGRELAINLPPMRDAVQSLNNLFAEKRETPLSSIIYPPPAFDDATKTAQLGQLRQTEYAQPAIGAMSMGLYKMAQSCDFKADFTAGHSFGELSALWAAGSLTDSDYLRLVKARGDAMSARNASGRDVGTMLAVTASVQQMQAELRQFPQVTLANMNSNDQQVLAGSNAAIAQVAEYLSGKGYKTVALPVSAAFHTDLVGHAQRPFAGAIQQTRFQAPQATVFANSTAQPYPNTATGMQQLLTDHLLNPVRFKEQIENIYRAGGTIFVEFGPRNILTNLVKNILADQPHVAIALNASRQKDSDWQLRDSLTQLRVLGLPLTSLDTEKINIKPEKVGKLNVQLSGYNYVNEDRKTAFEQGLEDGFQLSVASQQNGSAVAQLSTNGHDVQEPVAQPPVVEEVAPKPELVIVAPPVVAPTPQPAPVETPALPELDLTPSADQDLTGLSPQPFLTNGHLREFHQFQREAAQAHEQYLKNQTEYVTTFRALNQQLEQMMAAEPNTPQTPQSQAALTDLRQSLQMFQTFQAETVSAHQQYLHQQAQYADAFLEMLDTGDSAIQRFSDSATQPVAPSLVTETASAVGFTDSRSLPEVQIAHTANNQQLGGSEPPQIIETAVALQEASQGGQSNDELAQTMLEVVSEKTGYPVEMLDMSMDMEADLGIDSINRVEILAGVQERYPELPAVNPEDLGELRTLQEIVDFIGKDAPSVPTSPSSVPPSGGEAVQRQATEPTADTQSDLAQTMLEVVSEKTGYPVEMLEMGMDMEADLGIDSINRVEILAGVQERYPELPAVNPEDLGELRTLQEIVDFIGKDTPSSPPSGGEAVQRQATEPIVDTQSETSNTQIGLTQTMLEVVSEKTGYPVEMLEMGMDMEADLGIDSINRVEILAGVQERYPELPAVNPEDLGELRTLQEIVDFIGKDAPSSPVSQPTSPPSVPPSGGEAVQPVIAPLADTPATESPNHRIDESMNLAQTMLEVVSEKTGYPVEMLEMGMDMEADLGIDSINRVEILAGVQERYPELPAVNPEDLGELRTLQEIVDFIGKDAPSMPISQPTSPLSVPPSGGEVSQPVIAPLADTPATESPNHRIDESMNLAQTMLEVVSEKTGYPVEMLEMGMDMEADLGIDSINRVEILAGVQERYPELPAVNPEDLGELRTLQEIVDFIGKDAPNSPPSVPPSGGEAVQRQATEPIADTQYATSNTQIDLAQTMLEVVSEKTGYPVEMLEMGMDMEADLGIDSINRVEILAGVQERYPELPAVNPEDLGELRTLQEIVDFIGKDAPSGPVSQPTSPPPSGGEAVQRQATEPIADTQYETSNTQIDLAQTMLEVVSEKTGYPVDMLEMGMDMEADLGIDSINRVEILAGVQERYPELPAVNPEDLGELRTLQEIVDFIGKDAPSGPVSQPTSPPSGGEAADDEQLLNIPPASEYTYIREELPPHNIQVSAVQLKNLPRPDQQAFTLRPGQVCLLTDDGTEITISLAQQLQQRGFKVVVLAFPTYIVPAQANWLDSIDRVVLSDLSESHLSTQVEQISQQFGPVGAFIHVGPTRLAAMTHGLHFIESERAQVKHIFLLAKHLQKMLNAQDGSAFLTVARMDGAFGTVSPEDDVSPLDGSLFGLTKTVNQEWPTVYCRAIDASTSLNDAQVIDAILTELADPNRLLVEVAYGKDGRVTLI